MILRHRAADKSHAHGATVLAFLLAFLLVAAPPTPVLADDFPPYWDDSNPATNSLHFPLMPWPATDADWGGGYTNQGSTINDLRTADPSNGGRAPQNYANVSSQCSDGSTESVYWFFDDDAAAAQPSPTLFFRWRVEQIPNTYATGPAPGAYSNIDPWKSAQWTVLIDTDGDGYREFAVQVDGATGLPATPIDMLQSIYSNTESQTLDFDDDPDVYRLFHQPTAFIDFTTSQILNFRSALNPAADWPNGSAETVWDYGTTRVTNISLPTCEEYLVDYQIPLAMLDATSVGGPKLDEYSPFCLAFVTANSNENPLQKDFAFNGPFTADVDGCVPCGDLITLAGDVVPQPVVDQVGASGCGPATLTARVRDATNADCSDSLTSVDFYYCYDADASGTCDTSGSESWVTTGGSTAVDADDPSAWSLTWDSSLLLKGQYLIGVRAEDDQGNITWSYLTTAEAAALGAGNYANPGPDPGVLTDSFLNSCGNFYEVLKTAASDFVSQGSQVQFTITVDNQTTDPLTVTSITDILPPGFSYVSTDGGTAPLDTPSSTTVSEVIGDGIGNDDGVCDVLEVIGDGIGNDDGVCDALEACYQENCTVTWDYGAGALIGAASSSQILFTADTDYVPEGTYANTAEAVTDSGTLRSEPLDVGVGAPRLTILKTVSDYSVLPGDPVTYSITYSNDSPVNAGNVTITDPLPAGTTFVAATGGGVYDSGTRTITWAVGSLASLEGPYTVSFEVLVDKGANAKTVNTATIDSDETGPADGSVTIFVLSPLQIEKTANKSIVDPAGASPDNEVVFSVTYQNTGATSLTSVAVVDTTPPGFTYLSNTGGGTAVEPGGDGYGNNDGTCDTGEPCAITWTIGTLTSGSGSTVTVTLRVVNPYTETDNPAVNSAVISSDQLNDIEDSAEIGIVEGDCQGSPDTYWFRDLDASTLPFPEEGGTPLPTTSERYYANQTAPTSPTAADIGPLTMPQDVEVEIGHFYQDPPLDRPTGFSFTGNVDIWVYIDKPGGSPVGITAYLYDYDPDTGVAIQIGQQQQASCNGKCSNEEITFSIIPTGVLNERNLMLWRFTGTGGNNSGDLDFNFDGTGSMGRSEVCFAPLSVALNKSVDLVVANPTDTLTYTVGFSNTGLRDVTGAQIVDTIPAGSALQTSTLNGSLLTQGVDFTCVTNPDNSETCTYDVNTATGAAGVLVGGESGTLILTTLIDSEVNLRAAGIESLTNSAVLSTDDTEDVDDSATTDVNLTALPEIVLMKTADATRLLPGDTVTYTVTVLNVGDAASGTVTITDVIPAETWFTYVAGSISGGDSRSDGAAPTLTWTINSLASGGTATLTFQMLAAATGVPAGVNEKDNKATGTEATPTTVPDSNTVTVSITTNAILSIGKTVSSPAAATDSVGTGDGSTTVFNGTLSDTPVQSGSVRVLVAGTEVGVDSGTGVIVGTALTASTIDYTTGALHLEFLTAPANGDAVTAVSYAELSPGDTVEYTMTTSNIGAGDASSVTVSDPIPTYTTYAGGTLEVGGASRTDAVDADNASYDAVIDRTLFSLGTLAPGDSETTSFSAVIDSVMPNGTTSVANTATASSPDTAGKSASAVSKVKAAPVLGISKSGPSTVPYPLTTVNGKQKNGTTLTVFSTQYFNSGDLIYVEGQTATVTGVLSATQITVDTLLDVSDGALVLPTIRYRLTYTNNGTAAATNLRVKDLLQVTPDLNYITADPAPDSDPGFDANGIVTWNIASLAAGESGSITLWTVPTAAGTYDNLGTLSSSELDDVDSNTVTTNAGGIELTKQTSTYPPVPTIVNDPSDGADQVTYVITLNPQIAGALTGITVIDSLPPGFTFNSTTSILPLTAVCGTTPLPGDTTPTWNNCTLPAGNTMTITFLADIAPTVGAGTYQNGVWADSNELDVLAFDELITDADDVTITIPGDLRINKSAQILSDPCEIDTCLINYAITATNVGTSTVTAAVINDVLPNPDTTYVGDDGGGAYNPGTGDWTMPVPLASGGQTTLNVTATLHSLDVVTNCATRTSSTPNDTNAANDTSCASIVPTPAALSGFKAWRRGGSVVVQWETALESGTIGFRLLRLHPSTGEFTPVSRKLLPGLINSPAGGTYRLRDRAAPTDEDFLTYLLVEVDGRGDTTEHGPFTVNAGAPPDAPDQFGAQDYTRTMRPLPEARKARLKLAREERRVARQFLKGRKGRAAKITTSREGLHYISAAEVADLFNVDERKVRSRIGKAKLRLFGSGRNIAYLPAAENAGLFFFAEEYKNNYTEQNVYWLHAGKGRHMRRMKNGALPGPELSVSSGRLHAEIDRDALPTAFSDPDADYWLWEYLMAGDPLVDTREFTFQARGVWEESATAVLTVNLFGITNTAADPDHHVKVSLNGTELGEAFWDGVAAHVIEIPFDQALLKEGSNTLGLTALLDTGAGHSYVYLNDFDVAYRRLHQAADGSVVFTVESAAPHTVGGFSSPEIMVFDVTDPGRPVWHSGAVVEEKDGFYRAGFVPGDPGSEFLAVSAGAALAPDEIIAGARDTLRKIEGARYVIVTTEALAEAAAELADYRQGTGLKSMVVTVDEVYDSFSDGIPTPLAIRELVRHARKKWDRKMKFLVLAGEGTFDYRDLGGHGDNLVPPLMVPTPWGLVTSDNALADIDGDHVPEAAVGRLPVLTSGELTALVARIAAYEGSSGEAWERRILFAADDPNPGADFPACSEDLAACVGADYSVERIYLSEMPLSEARQALQDAINNGVFFLSYIGHGGLDRFASEQLLSKTDVTDLLNGSMLPVVTAMTCYVGGYGYPGFDSLGEALVMHDGGGAVALWGPSGLSLNDPAVDLARHFYDTVFIDGERILGEAVRRACREYGKAGNALFEIDMYNILGDPALRLR